MGRAGKENVTQKKRKRYTEILKPTVLCESRQSFIDSPFPPSYFFLGFGAPWPRSGYTIVRVAVASSGRAPNDGWELMSLQALFILTYLGLASVTRAP